MTTTMTGEPGDARAAGGFEVHLDVFEGPFDLLLALISKHKLDITEIALSSVTDEFIAYIRAKADGWDLDQASYFLVVAATLLDLKAARLLPAGEVDDEEDLALLEARDLLFARLLQYRAYKEVAAVLASKMAAAGRRFPRRVPMEPRFVDLLPEVLLGLGPVEFAAIAARTLAPRRPPVVSTAHLHMPLHQRPRAGRPAVRAAGAAAPGHVPAAHRGLRAGPTRSSRASSRCSSCTGSGRVGLDQVAPLGDLYVSWTEGGQPDDETSTQKADG